MSSRKKRIFHSVTGVLILIFIAFLTLAAATALTEYEAHIPPDYLKTDISAVLAKKQLTDTDYTLLYYQTGLGKAAIDDLREQYEDSAERIMQFQENFFRKIKYVCKKNSIISRQENIVNDEGTPISGTQLAPLRNGDILITKASHTYGWRQGHTAIVVDAANGKILEAVVVGTNSTFQDADKWTKYANFIVLRLKNASTELTDAIAKTAASYLNGIPYILCAGLLSSSPDVHTSIKGTHCSHLVWQAYRWYGIDLDSDGGLVVTPKDIANSPELEIIQVYGVNPENIWP